MPFLQQEDVGLEVILKIPSSSKGGHSGDSGRSRLLHMLLKAGILGHFSEKRCSEKCQRVTVAHVSPSGAEMDLVLRAADHYVFTPYLYPASWPEDNFFRQTLSLLIVTNLGAYILYFVFATFSYYFIFDHSLMKHPQFLKVSDFLTCFNYCYSKKKTQCDELVSYSD